ncbi:MAG TPA: hypothetical protein VK092_03445, partial [Deinococcales bacterium]|nr:hypothetical protein [Deinococcales bacterium]
MYDTASGLIPAYPAQQAGEAEPADAEGQGEPSEYTAEPGYAVQPDYAVQPEYAAEQEYTGQAEYSAQPEHPVPPEPAEYSSLHYAADPGAVGPDEPQPALAAAAHQPYTSADEKKRQRRAPIGLIAAAIICLVGVGAAVALLLTFLGGDDQTPVADPETSPAEEAGAEESPAEEADGEADGGQEDQTQQAEPGPQEALDEARTAVSSLPDESACETDEDSGVLASFIAAGTETEDFPGDDEQLLQDTFDQLQTDCSTTHAASVFTAVRGGTAFEDAAPDDAQAVMDSVGTEWADRAVGTRGAEPVGGFTAQDGNVECAFDDGLTCTVFDTTPQLCEDGSTYTMTVDGVDVDCDGQLESNGYDTLAEGDSATDGFLVCTEMSDRLSCYNSLDPFGFEMSNTGNYAY